MTGLSRFEWSRRPRSSSYICDYLYTQVRPYVDQGLRLRCDNPVWSLLAASRTTDTRFHAHKSHQSQQVAPLRLAESYQVANPPVLKDWGCDWTATTTATTKTLGFERWTEPKTNEPTIHHLPPPHRVLTKARSRPVIAPAWPPGLPEPDPIRHKWQCSRPAPEDHYRIDPKTGQPTVVKRCPSCGGIEKPAPSWRST
jgi:hypothetical protein